MLSNFSPLESNKYFLTFLSVVWKLSFFHIFIQEFYFFLPVRWAWNGQWGGASYLRPGFMQVTASVHCLVCPVTICCWSFSISKMLSRTLLFMLDTNFLIEVSSSSLWLVFVQIIVYLSKITALLNGQMFN
jgi:hypothetical protein